MSARKKSNLRPSQDKHEERRLALINKALAVLHGEKVTFPDVTALAKRVADMVSMEERLDPGVKKPGIKPSTLLRFRNGVPGPYRLQLDMFFEGRFDPNSTPKTLTSKDVEAYIRQYPALRAYIAKKDLEIANLKNDLQSEREGLKRLKTHLQNLPQGSQQLPEGGAPPRSDELQQARQDLSLTLTWVERFMRSQETLEIDEENEVILDLTTVRHKPIAEKSLLAPFFRAVKLRKQQVRGE